MSNDKKTTDAKDKKSPDEKPEPVMCYIIPAPDLHLVPLRIRRQLTDAVKLISYERQKSSQTPLKALRLPPDIMESDTPDELNVELLLGDKKNDSSSNSGGGKKSGGKGGKK